jgi:Uma2 family endonuclease
LYQKAKVREYWIVDPENKFILVFLPDDGGSLRTQEVYQRGDIARVSILEGCFIDLGKVFSEDSEDME